MPGVKDVQTKRNDEKKQFAGNKDGVLELWLRDGEQATITILASGKPDDLRLDDFYSHSITYKNDDGTTARRDVYCTKETEKCQYCEAGDRPGHRFAFWCYVYSILHPDKKDDSWGSVKSPTGDVNYREDINSIRVFSKGFGKGDYIWNQVVDIFTESGDLRKQQIRLKRTGSTMQDTSYTFMLSALASKLPEEMAAKAKPLESIKSFYQQKFSIVKSEDVDVEKQDDHSTEVKTATTSSQDSEPKPVRRGRPLGVSRTEAAAEKPAAVGKLAVLEDEEEDASEVETPEGTVEDDDELF